MYVVVCVHSLTVFMCPPLPTFSDTALITTEQASKTLVGISWSLEFKELERHQPSVGADLCLKEKNLNNL